MALFDKFNKDMLLQKVKQTGQQATVLSQKAAVAVKTPFVQAKNKIDQKKEEHRLSKLPQEGGIKRYEVRYRGGLPGYPREKEVSLNPVIYMDVMPDRFSFLPNPKSASWFAGVEIPYSRVISLEIVERIVNTVEAIVSIGRENMDFSQRNVLELTYLAEDGEEYVMRSEMFTGLTTMGEARVCLELIDILRSNKLLKQFAGRQEDAEPTQPKSTDVVQQLRDFKDLLDSGVITQEEFDAKKKQLLEL